MFVGEIAEVLGTVAMPYSDSEEGKEREKMMRWGDVKRNRSWTVRIKKKEKFCVVLIMLWGRVLVSDRCLYCGEKMNSKYLILYHIKSNQIKPFLSPTSKSLHCKEYKHPLILLSRLD